MRRILFAAMVLALPLCLLLVQVGAGQNGQKQLLQTNGWGSLSGRVLYKGVPPKPADITDKMKIHADKACCLGGKGLELVDNTWIVDPKTMGVANVLIYLKAPTGKYFPIHVADKKRADTVVLDQPHCMFDPHVLALYPSYFDGEKQVPTGQKFIVKNSAPVPHNTRATGNATKPNNSFNINLPPGGELPKLLEPQPLPILINCDIHPWMGARIGVYEHPYFAVTKSDGTFEIPRVPAGATVTVMGWHEDVGYVPGKEGKQVEIKQGKNEVEFDVTKK